MKNKDTLIEIIQQLNCKRILKFNEYRELFESAKELQTENEELKKQLKNTVSFPIATGILSDIIHRMLDYHCDKTKYRYELGRRCIPIFIDDIINDFVKQTKNGEDTCDTI